jgi:putative hydrolase of the HAD superfamily
VTTALRVIVFDIDDTLYLERDYVRSGFSAVGAVVRDELGLVEFGDRCWALFEAGHRGDVFNRVVASYGRDPEPATVSRLVELYREHQPAISLIPEMHRLVEEVATRAALAVVSDGPPASQRRKAMALGLDRWFDPIVLTGERPAGWAKPSTLPFALIERVLGASGPQCLYIADNPAKDFQGPSELGWLTMRVRWPDALHETVADEATVSFSTPSSARDWLLAHLAG